MTERDFIAEILANSDDDVPRLIYADWLEERSDPLGEFIRVQCELARLSPPGEWHGMYGHNPPAATAADEKTHEGKLRVRQMHLLRAHCTVWVAPLGRTVTGVFFQRGFVEGCNTDAASFFNHAARWYASIPLRQLYLKFARRGFRRWLESPLLLNLDTLDLSGADRYVNTSSLEDTDILMLADCPHLANLRRLHLGNFLLHRAEGKALLNSPHLRKLQCLRARGAEDDIRPALEARFGSLALRG